LVVFLLDLGDVGDEGTEGVIELALVGIAGGI
jgi:hypothetical protein